MRFVISVIDSTTGTATGDEMTAIDTFNAALQAAGEFVLAVGLTQPNDAQVIDARTTPPITTTGPLHDTDDYVSGLWIIDVADDATAHDRAIAASRACNRRVELRAILGG